MAAEDAGAGQVPGEGEGGKNGPASGAQAVRPLIPRPARRAGPAALPGLEPAPAGKRLPRPRAWAEGVDLTKPGQPARPAVSLRKPPPADPPAGPARVGSERA